MDANLRMDQVGSLLRPQKLKDIYTRHGNGETNDDELRRIQDESVGELIAKQESHGLSIFTDGEYRRLNFQDSFVESVSGFIPKKQTLQFQESRTLGGEALQRWQPDSAKTDPALQYWRPIAQQLRLARNVPLSEWRSASTLTNKPVKVTLIATDRICENFQRQNAAGVYASAEQYRADVIAIERGIVQQLADAGCPYIHTTPRAITATSTPSRFDACAAWASIRCSKRPNPSQRNMPSSKKSPGLISDSSLPRNVPKVETKGPTNPPKGFQGLPHILVKKTNQRGGGSNLLSAKKISCWVCKKVPLDRVT